MRAAAKGIVQSTDLVPMGMDGRDAASCCTTRPARCRRARPTGSCWPCRANPVEWLYLDLKARRRQRRARRRLRRAPPGPRRRHRRRTGRSGAVIAGRRCPCAAGAAARPAARSAWPSAAAAPCSIGDGTAAAAGDLAGIATAPVRAVRGGGVRAGGLGGGAGTGRWPTTTSSCCPPRPTGATSRPAWPHVLGRPLLAGAIARRPTHGADAGPPGRPRDRRRSTPAAPFVATLQPGRAGRRAGPGAPTSRSSRSSSSVASTPATRATPRCSRCCRPTSPPWTSPRRRASSAAAPASTRAERFRLLERVAAALGASVGATRVVTDRGWVGARAPDRHDRRRRRPAPLRRLRDQRRRAAHERPRPARPHRQREHRPALPDDAARRPAPSWPTPTRCSTSSASPAPSGEVGAPMPDVDVVVVGAGPAGSAAALDPGPRRALASLLVERGPFPGAKNMYGGVVYPRILDALLPRWWEEAPIQRWVDAPLHDDADRARRPSPSTTAPTAWGRAAVQRRHRLPPRLRRVAGRQGRGRRRRAGVLHDRRPGCSATAAARRRRAHRPARRRPHRPTS